MKIILVCPDQPSLLTPRQPKAAQAPQAAQDTPIPPKAAEATPRQPKAAEATLSHPKAAQATPRQPMAV